MSGLTETIARFINEKTIADFPEGTIERAKKVIIDTFAVILAGAGSEVEEPLMAYLNLSDEGGSSPVLGTERRCGVEMSALINGSFGHALDFDDVLSMMPAHPSAIIVAALIADLQNHPLTGRAFIEAYVVGVEVGARIAQGMTVGHYGRGWHGTGTLGTYSALGALTKAWGCDVDTTRTAFGIATSMVSGVRRNFGTMTKPLHTGLAARNALQATRLAMCGFTAAGNALESKSGFFSTYGVEASDPQVAINGLGNPWVMLEPGIALKKFACCYAMHRGMDGLLVLQARHGFKAEDVVSLECRMPPGGMLVLTYPEPVTGLEGKFSMQYGLAAGLLDGAYTLHSFEDDSVKRPGIHQLYQRINAHEDECCRGDDPLFETRSSGSRGYVEVEVVLRNGTRDMVRIHKAPGHPSRELTWDDIAAKFADCAHMAHIDQGRASDALARLRDLEHNNDVPGIVALLHH